MWDFSEGRPQKLVDFGVPDADSGGSAGQCLNLAFVHAIAVPEVDMVDRLGKTRNLLRIAIFNISYIRGLSPEKYFNDKSVPALVSLSSSDLLQKDNVSNQREHIVLLLANQQTRLRILDELEPVEESKFVIEAKTIQRMELLALGVGKYGLNKSKSMCLLFRNLCMTYFFGQFRTF
ncbi:hypothetical protein ACSBR2_033824 [Camellia fascicularis]